MIISKINDVYVKVDTEPNIGRELVDFFTFEVAGARFMPTYKSRVWDGKIRLYNQMTGEIYFGLIPYVEEFAKRNDIEIIFKLHPQQNFHNDIIKSTITKFDPKIQILQDESINEVLKNADFLINISPDNLDASTVVFESMLQEIPIFNIKLQKNSWIYDFETMNAVKSFDYDSNFQDEILEIINNLEFQNLQINNIKKFLEFYLYDKKFASKNLINFISKN